jgi:hypothetical protein
MNKLIKNSTLMIAFIIISGCASTGNKSQISESCEHFSNTNQWGKNTHQEVNFLKEQTGEFISFYEITPSKILSGIESVELNNAKLTLKIENKALFDEYSAPNVKNIKQISYEAHNLTGTFTPVGSIVWLFNPKLMNDYTFGCTENQKLGEEVDISQKYKNGKSKWMDVHKSHKIKISGLDKEYIFNTNQNLTNEIDLTNFILNNNLKNNTEIKVECESCDLLNEKEKKLYPKLKKFVFLNNEEFNKNKEIITNKYDTNEKTNIKKEKKLLYEKKHESIIKNLDSAKEKCKEFRLKPNTDKFGKCILNLTK